MISLVDIVKALDMILSKDGLVSENKKKAEVFYSNGSLIKLISKFIITPTFVVSNSVKGNNVIKEVLEYNTSLFASLYTRDFDISKISANFSPPPSEPNIYTKVQSFLL